MRTTHPLTVVGGAERAVPELDVPELSVRVELELRTLVDAAAEQVPHEDHGAVVFQRPRGQKLLVQAKVGYHLGNEDSTLRNIGREQKYVYFHCLTSRTCGSHKGQK